MRNDAGVLPFRSMILDSTRQRQRYVAHVRRLGGTPADRWLSVAETLELLPEDEQAGSTGLGL